MNERMIELAQEAGMYVDLNGNPWPKWMSAEECEVAYKKFAELIVQECLDACSRANDIKHFVPPTQEQVVLSCMREIETTFRS